MQAVVESDDSHPAFAQSQEVRKNFHGFTIGCECAKIVNRIIIHSSNNSGN